MFEKGNDSGAFFLHCLEGPARTGHPGRCRARCSAHLRSPTLQYQRSPPAAEGPEKFSNSPGLTQEVAWPPRPETTQALPPPAWPKQEVAQEGAPPSANLLSPELLPPAPHVGWTGGDPSQIGCPKTPRGAGPRPQTARLSGAASGLSVFAADPAEHHQAKAQRQPPARPPDSPRPPKPGAQASLRAARGPTRNHKPGASAVLERGSGPGRKAAGRPGAQRVAGGRPHHGLQRAVGTACTPQPRSLVQHPGNGGLGGVCRPGEGARRGGRAAAAAPIGPGSRPSARAPAPSRDAPPRLVRRRPEGSSPLPVSRTS